MKNFFYLMEIQYLGFRYHGWQMQPNVKTVQLMVERTLNFVLETDQFRILATGRTDSMVSANQSYCELFLKEEKDPAKLMEDLNYNLPPDIRILSIEELSEKFNVIQSAKMKEYLYLFSFGQKNHPFAAPFISYLLDDLDIDIMVEGAALFQGTYNFQNYCYKPSEKTVFERSVEVCEIVPNTFLTANFFPEKCYALRVKGQGFMRHQVRMMMGSLISLGKGEITLDDIRKSLTDERDEPINKIAPASGLLLNGVEFSLKV